MSENKNSLKQLMLELMLIREKYSEAQIIALHDILSNKEISKKGNFVFKILQLLQGLESNLDTSKSIPKNSATKETVTAKEVKKKSSNETTEKEKQSTKNLKKSYPI